MYKKIILIFLICFYFCECTHIPEKTIAKSPGNSRESSLDMTEKYIQDLKAAAELNPQSAVAWYYNGLLRYREKHWTEALDCLDTALSLYRESNDPQGTASVLFYKGEVYKSSYKYDEAAACFEEALGLYRQQGDKYEEGKVCARLGTVNLATSQYARAEEYMQQALSIFKEFDDKPAVLLTLNQLGIIFNQKADYPQALEYYRESLALAGELQDKNNKGQALMNIGTLYQYQARYQAAVEYFQQAIELFKATDDKQSEAKALYNSGIVYAKTAEYKQALANFKAALALFEEFSFRQGVAASLDAIGNIYSELAEFPLALEQYQRSLAIKQQIKSRFGEGVTLSNLGAVQMQLSQFTRSYTYYEKAIAIFEEIGNQYTAAEVLNSISTLYILFSEYARAEKSLGKALLLCRETGNKYIEGRTLENQALLYFSLSDYEKSLEFLQQAITVCRSNNDRAGEGEILINTGLVYHKLGKPKAAVAAFTDALVILKETGNRYYEGNCLYKLAAVYADMEDFPRAFNCTEAALPLCRATGNNLGEGMALALLGTVHYKLKQYQEALDALQKAVEIIESIRGDLLYNKYKMGFMQDKMPIYQTLCSLLLEMHDGNPDKGYEELAFYYAEKARARSLLEFITEGQVQVTRGIDPGLLDKEQLLNQQYSYISSQLQTEYSLEETARNRKKIEVWEDKLDTLTDELDALEYRMVRQNPGYAALKYPGAASVQEVQKILDQNTILLKYLVTEESILLWCITDHNCTVYRIPLTMRELRDKMEIFRNSMRFQFPENQAAAHLHSLYELLLAQAISTVPAGKTLLIVPDGDLGYLPFEALVQESTHLSPAHIPYLIRDYPVAYVPSATFLTLLKKKKHPGRPALFAVGDPLLKGSTGPGTEPVDNNARFADKLAGLGRLVYSREEVRQITALFDDKRILLDAEAKEEMVKTPGMLKHFSHIHFATHSLLDEETPDNSGLVLSQDDDPAEDGFLQVREIFNLELEADLVVLSACRSGLGRQLHGEGFIGLTRAFMYAGAASLVISLWNVDDRSPVDFMRNFYTHLITEGVPAIAALRKTKLAMLDDSRYSHPAFWACFILFGR